MKDRPLLDIRDIHKYYKDNNAKEFKVLSNVSISLYENECIAIVGESGCGKSTIARIICKLTSMDQGCMFFDNKDVSTIKNRVLKEYYKQIQMIFQEPLNTFSGRMKIQQYMIEPYINFKLLNRKDAIQYSKELLENVGLDESYLNRYAEQLSGGELQRVTIARTIGLKPRIVIYDECTSALDVSIQKQIIDLITDLKLKNRFSSIFITHDLALAENISDRIYIMRRGEVVEILSGGDIVKESRHPYSIELINSVLTI